MDLPTTFSEPHCQIIAVRSKHPFKLSVVVEPTECEVLLIKSHEGDESATIEHKNVPWYKSLNRTIVDKKQAFSVWDDSSYASKMATDEDLTFPQNIPLSRSTSASSFEAIMEPQIWTPSMSTTCFPTLAQMSTHSVGGSMVVTENENSEDIKMIPTPVKQVDKTGNTMEVILKNVMDMVNLAGIANDQASLECLKRMIFRFAEEILADDSLLDLPYESLVKTISIDRGDSIMEYALVKSILRWTSSQEDRTRHLPTLLKFIKLDKLTPEQLIELGNQKLVRSSLDCRDIIDEYKNSLIMSQSMNLHSISISSNLNDAGISLPTSNANASTIVPTTSIYLYILARGRTEATEDYSIHQIDMKSGISLKIPSQPTFLCVNIEDNLYVIGHPMTYGRSVEMYNFERQFWSTKKCWPTDLIISSTCVVGKHIYFLGFRDNGPYSLHQYDPDKDEVTPIRIAYEWVAIDGDIILAYEGLVLFVKTGLAYNPTRQYWKNLSPIPEKMVNGQSLIAFKDRLINFSVTDQSFYWYNPKQGTEGTLAKWDDWLSDGGTNYSLSPRVDLLVLNSKLYLVEKAIFENCTLQIIQYDENNERWIKLHSIKLVDKPIRCAICSSDS